MAELPAVPLTLEGAWMLHQMFRIKRPEWRQLSESDQDGVVQEARQALSSNRSAVFSLIGHKGDVMLLHFRDSLEDLHLVELSVARLRLSDYLEPTHSYLSVVELGLYESSTKTYGALSEKGMEPHSEEWKAGIAEVTARQSAAMAPRLFPEIPAAKYICFYPMDRKRAEEKNWYQVPMAERQRMMHDHGMIGRRYADRVRQIISGSIGFDDWEWGVDLFADDPLVFKKLIYEMRFDEVSAVYALFGPFYVGVRVPPSGLSGLFKGELGAEV
jgi:chlorite dismutase